MGLGVLVGLSWLAFSDGGFFPSSWGLETLILLGLLAAGAFREIRAGIATAAALSALALWALLSAAWSADPAASVLEAQRGLLYAAAVAVILVFARSALAVLVAVLATCAAVASYALGSGGVGTLAAPIGYANALGALAAIGLVLAIGLAREHARALALAAVPLGAVVWLSGSRAAVLAAVAGLAVMVALRRGRLAVLVLAAVVIAAGAWPSWSSLRAREPIWSVAWHAAEQHPALGVGAGAFDRVWWQERPVPRGARDAHSLYLETLAELGPVGLALLAAALVTPLAAAVRARGQPLVPVAAGGFAAFLTHAAVDWDWEVPAVALGGLACGAAVLVAAGTPARAVAPRSRFALAAGALVLAALVGLGYAGNAALDRTHAAIAAGSLTAADASARTAARWAPWSAAPWLAVGEAALRRGDYVLARDRLRRGLARDAGDWELWAALAHASRGAERRSAARRAAALNPLGAIRG